MLHSVQIYGINQDIDEILKVLKNLEIFHMEGNFVGPSGVENLTQINEKGAVYSGLHCTIYEWEKLNNNQQETLLNISCNRLIIPAAIEENSLRWPLSFFRRFPFLYKRMINLIDHFKFKGLRKVVAGKNVIEKDYFKKSFWLQFAAEINNVSASGIDVGFHNHGFEFEKVDGEVTPFELLDLHLDHNVFFQFDLTNCLMSGHFSIELMKKYLHRIKSYHLRIEGVGSEEFYESVVGKNPEIFQGKELVVELKENSVNSIISRLNWWKNLVKDINAN